MVHNKKDLVDNIKRKDLVDNLKRKDLVATRYSR